MPRRLTSSSESRIISFFFLTLKVTVANRRSPKQISASDCLPRQHASYKYLQDTLNMHASGKRTPSINLRSAIKREGRRQFSIKWQYISVLLYGCARSNRSLVDSTQACQHSRPGRMPFSISLYLGLSCRATRLGSLPSPT